MKKIVTDNDLGNILLSKSIRAKRLILKVKTPGSIVVTIPHYSNYDDALKFVDSKREWIVTNKNKINSGKKLICNENPIKTLTFEVVLKQAHRRDFFVSLKGGFLTIEYPESVLPESEKAQKIFRQAIEKGMKHEAKRVLPTMLKEQSQIHGFSYSGIKIMSGRTRWGSCSSKGNINLSYYLMSLPEHLVKYVLLHELCHTKEMNHGIKFWTLFNSVSNNKAKTLAKEIKKYNMF